MDGDPKPCNCRKSRCLKLYCECFASGTYCSTDTCRCVDCHNLKAFELERTAAIAGILERRPNAFRSKIQESGGMLKHQVGCNCKRSRCLKKYCECYQGEVYCGEQCRCHSCANYEGSDALARARHNKKSFKQMTKRARSAARQAAAAKRKRSRGSQERSPTSSGNDPDFRPSKRSRASLRPTMDPITAASRTAQRSTASAAPRLASTDSSALIDEEEVLRAAGRMLTSLAQPAVRSESVLQPQGLSAWDADGSPATLSQRSRSFPEPDALSMATSPPRASAQSHVQRAALSEDERTRDAPPMERRIAQRQVPAHLRSSPRVPDILSPRTERVFVWEVAHTLHNLSERVAHRTTGRSRRALAQAMAATATAAAQDPFAAVGSRSPSPRGPRGIARGGGGSGGHASWQVTPVTNAEGSAAPPPRALPMSLGKRGPMWSDYEEAMVPPTDGRGAGGGRGATGASQFPGPLFFPSQSTEFGDADAVLSQSGLSSAAPSPKGGGAIDSETTLLETTNGHS